MKRKTALALAGISTILIASFAIVPLTSSSPGSEKHRYIVMGGVTKASIQLGAFPPEHWTVPFATRPPYLLPMVMEQNITFTDPWFLLGYGWIVNLTVPAATYIGLEHTWWDQTVGTWFTLNMTMASDGYGWLFLNASGDVDCYTSNNNTGVYWDTPGDPYGFNGTLAALSGQLPSPGPDGVAGTADDGFGDGTPDPQGSSVLLLPSTMHLYYWNGTQWLLMVSTSFPQVMTTGTAYDIVNELTSVVDGVNSTDTGQPWEYYAGLGHSGQQVPHDHPQWNAYVTYACAWSKLNIPMTLGPLDIIWQIVEKKVREDCVIPDVNCDEIADFKDLYMAARAFDSQDEGLGFDGKVGGGDDKPVADTHYDARCDILAEHGIINIMDYLRIALEYDFDPGIHVPDSWQGTISIVPSSTTAYVGQTIEVNITVSDVTDLYLVLFCIRWNPNVLNCTEVLGHPSYTPGDLLPTPPNTYFLASDKYNFTEGYIEAFLVHMWGPVPGVNGSGTIVTLEFEVIGPGSSQLDLYSCHWMNSTSGQFGFLTEQDGSFSTRSCVFPVSWQWGNYGDPQNPAPVNLTANVATTGCCLAVQNFTFDRSLGQIMFDIAANVSGSCNVTVPKLLMDGAFKVLVDDTLVPSILAWNRSHTFVYFTYSQGIHNVKILGEIVTRIRSLDLLTLADVNGDGEIDIMDILALGMVFGWKDEWEGS